jgi:hypothetical protein
MPGYFIYNAATKKSLKSLGQYGLITKSGYRSTDFQKETQICWVPIW